MRTSAINSLALLTVTLLSGCYRAPELDYHDLCASEDPSCLAKDHDGDGVKNGEDDFPFDKRCSRLSDEDCSRCGVGCDAPQVCIKAQRQCGVMNSNSPLDRFTSYRRLEAPMSHRTNFERLKCL